MASSNTSTKLREKAAALRARYLYGGPGADLADVAELLADELEQTAPASQPAEPTDPSTTPGAGEPTQQPAS